MRWACIALALALGAPASAAPRATVLGPTVEIWSKGLIDELLDEDGFVVIELADNGCDDCRDFRYVARHIDWVEHPGRWHVHLVYMDGDVRDGGEILPGSGVPLLVLARDRHILAARDRNVSIEETEAWLAASAQRTEHIVGGPLECTWRMVDALVAPGRVDASDLIRYATLRTSGGVPHGDDPLVTAWGVLASFAVIDPHRRGIELGDLVVDTRDGDPRVLVVDLPTRPDADGANGTLVDNAGATARGSIYLGAPGDRGEIAVLRPTAGTFCRTVDQL
jgi:hypothetical protein